MKRLVHSDCLSVLQDSRLVPTGSIGLVYLDPPYGTERLFSAGLRRTRSALAGREPEAFDDRWDDYDGQVKLPAQVELVVKVAEGAGGRRLGTYVRYMAERLVALERGLSARASVYVHVSPPVAPYLRLVLDSVLGAQNFRNEIAWKRTHAHSSSKRFGPVHDTILFYARPGYPWHWPTTPADPAYFDKHYREVDEDGRRYQLVTCTGPGDRTGTGAHYEWRGQLPPPGRHWAWKRAEMERLEAVGRLRYSRNGVPRRVYYADEHEGVALQDIWTDISRLDSHSHERIGYDTQKPLALLERIVSSSAPLDGELVFDGFAGTGTTLMAADAAGMGWIGCDTSLKAVSLAIGRLGQAGVPQGAIDWHGGPTTAAEAEKLARLDAEAFGVWATGMLGLLPDPKLHSRDVLFARSERGARAVAGARVDMTHLRTLADAPGATRYAVSVTPAPAHPDVRSVPVELIAASAARHRAPLDIRGNCGG
jgi:DNA modification methylase